MELLKLKNAVTEIKYSVIIQTPQQNGRDKEENQ